MAIYQPVAATAPRVSSARARTIEAPDWTVRVNIGNVEAGAREPGHFDA